MLFDHLEKNADVEIFEVSQLQEEILKEIEADTFWCTTKLLDGIQDNYTFAQPGVQTKVQRLQELNESIDSTCPWYKYLLYIQVCTVLFLPVLTCWNFVEELHEHLKREQVEYLQFAFRWMNNLLMREIPLRLFLFFCTPWISYIM